VAHIPLNRKPLRPANRCRTVFLQFAFFEEFGDERAGGLFNDGAGAAEAEVAGEQADGFFAAAPDATLFSNSSEELFLQGLWSWEVRLKKR